MKPAPIYWLSWLLCLGLCTTGLGAAPVTVFAAASLTDSLQALGTEYQRQTGERVVFSFGASSTLERQIEAGAPADLFFSADTAQMDRLQAKGLLLQETRTNLLSNTLVIVVAAEQGAEVHSVQDLASPRVRRLALGDPKAVPIGVYARTCLQQLHLWEQIEPKVIATENVRAALAAVEAGNADASIVYQTDAAISPKVRVAVNIPAGKGPAIAYPVAVLREASALEAAKRFWRYLGSPAAKQVFRRFGFQVLD